MCARWRVSSGNQTFSRTSELSSLVFSHTEARWMNAALPPELCCFHPAQALRCQYLSRYDDKINATVDQHISVGNLQPAEQAGFPTVFLQISQLKQSLPNGINKTHHLWGKRWIQELSRLARLWMLMVVHHNSYKSQVLSQYSFTSVSWMMMSVSEVWYDTI